MFVRTLDRSLSRGAIVLVIVLGLVSLVLAVGSPADAKTIRERFFGIHDSVVASGDIPRVTTGAIRLWETGTSWREIERSPGSFDWTQLDAAVTNAEANGLRPLIVLGQTPRFYARNPGAPGAYGRGASSMPSIRAWTRYVGRVAHRYGTAVDYQIWNEPNVIGYWTGTVEQMATLTVTASRKITAVLGRHATITGPSFPLRLNSQKAWYQEYWHQTAGGRSLASYVDVIGATLYPQEDEAPEGQLPLLRFARQALPAAGRHKPLWNMEINYGLRGGPTAKRISRAKQASYASRTLLLNANSHVGRMYWFSWNISGIANTHLRRPAGGLTRAGRAWNVTHGWLLDTVPKGCHQSVDGRLQGLWTCKLRAGADEVRRVYYKPTGDAVPVTTVRSTRSWSDLAGHVTTRRGSFPISVGQLPVMVSSRR